MLLDKWTVIKPEVFSSVVATLSAPSKVHAGEALTYTVHLKNKSQYSLNGTQVRLSLPGNVEFAGTQGNTVTLQGDEVVVTVGRLASGGEQTVSIPVTVSPYVADVSKRSPRLHHRPLRQSPQTA